MNKQQVPKQSLDQGIATMERNKTPKRDLWQGIEFSIVNDQTKQVATLRNSKSVSKTKASLRYLAIAASICLFGFFGIMSMGQHSNIQGQPLIAALSADHQKQKHALLISFKDANATTTNWQQQIEDLDEAESAIKEALKEAPNNSALLKMLRQVYEQQLAIIEKVHAPAWQQI